MLLWRFYSLVICARIAPRHHQLALCIYAYTPSRKGAGLDAGADRRPSSAETTCAVRGWLAPRLGETAAVSLETPVMLAASWFVSRWCVDRLAVPRAVPARPVMGAVAFAMLMLAEIGVSVLAFGRSTTEHLASYASVPGAIGLLAQVVFATFPVVQVWRR